MKDRVILPATLLVGAVVFISILGAYLKPSSEQPTDAAVAAASPQIPTMRDVTRVDTGDIALIKDIVEDEEGIYVVADIVTAQVCDPASAVPPDAGYQCIDGKSISPGGNQLYENYDPRTLGFDITEDTKITLLYLGDEGIQEVGATLEEFIDALKNPGADIYYGLAFTTDPTAGMYANAYSAIWKIVVEQGVIVELTQLYQA